MKSSHSKQSTYFCIDIGNSRIKTAAFSQAGVLLHTQDFHTMAWEEISGVLTNLAAQNILYSSVANEPPSQWVSQHRAAGREVWALDGQEKLPFQSDYQSMHTLGKDRIAALAGAQAFFPATNCLVVDAGTCMTLDLLNEAGVFVGGNISPGIGMRLHSMHTYTARLPLVAQATLPTQLLGNSTEAAIRFGGQAGAAYEIEGLYHRLVAEYPNLNVILTGGDAPRLSEHLAIAHSVQPYLVLYGLYKIMLFYADQTV